MEKTAITMTWGISLPRHTRVRRHSLVEHRQLFARSLVAVRNKRAAEWRPVVAAAAAAEVEIVPKVSTFRSVCCQRLQQ